MQKTGYNTYRFQRYLISHLLIGKFLSCYLIFYLAILVPVPKHFLPLVPFSSPSLPCVSLSLVSVSPSRACHNGYIICGYGQRFLHTLIKCFSQLANIKVSPPYHFIPSHPLTIEEHIDQYLMTILTKFHCHNIHV